MEKIKNLYRSRSPKVKALVDVVVILVSLIITACFFCNYPLITTSFIVVVLLLIMVVGFIYGLYNTFKEEHEERDIRRKEKEDWDKYKDTLIKCKNNFSIGNYEKVVEGYNERSNKSKYESYTDRWGRQSLRLKEDNKENDN